MPAFRRFAIARTISTLGSAYGPIALSFGALEVFHGDAFPLSVVLAAQAIPQVLFILAGGVLADRLSQR
ncbi:MAG: MFS transporter, partial [Actinobacteria bacterium]|nr:MFS transporter [Actinomycetota bacterium]